MDSGQQTTLNAQAMQQIYRSIGSILQRSERWECIPLCAQWWSSPLLKNERGSTERTSIEWVPVSTPFRLQFAHSWNWQSFEGIGRRKCVRFPVTITPSPGWVGSISTKSLYEMPKSPWKIAVTALCRGREGKPEKFSRENGWREALRPNETVWRRAFAASSTNLKCSFRSAPSSLKGMEKEPLPSWGATPEWCTCLKVAINHSSETLMDKGKFIVQKSYIKRFSFGNQYQTSFPWKN